MKAAMTSRLAKAIALAILCTPVLRATAQDTYRKPEPPDDVNALAAKPTPKAADGHPDLSGRWVQLSVQGPSRFGARVQGNVHELYFGTPIEGADPDKDAVLAVSNGGTGEERRKVRQARNMPAYKPEFQAKVEMMGKDSNHYDPTTYSCLPAGVPRIGAPGMITQSPGIVVLLYTYSLGNNSTPYSTFRVVPTDGRPHRTADDYDPNPWGDPVGQWEGNTLVIETTGFDESTWFGPDGYFHSDAMKVTERFTRKGDTLEYAAIVEDPKVLTEPFNLNPVPLTLKKVNEILYNGDYPCDAHDFIEHADHENHL